MINESGNPIRPTVPSLTPLKGTATAPAPLVSLLDSPSTPIPSIFGPFRAGVERYIDTSPNIRVKDYHKLQMSQALRTLNDHMERKKRSIPYQETEEQKKLRKS